MNTAEGAVYKLKTIDFFKRKVPIVTQNENGPCPLLALANILLLRNHIHLPPNAPDVQQDRLISLVAEYLLDAHNEKRLESAGEVYKANLQQNIADAMALLPKLATGVDVNVRFNDIQAFEFTQDTAIFDLLDVRLVHGWLVDPSDRNTHEAIGEHSYNELVSQLVSLLGDSTPPHLLTPTAMSAHSREASFSGRASRPLCASGAPKPCQSRLSGGQQAEQAKEEPGLVASMRDLQVGGVDSQELQQALALSMTTDGAQPPAARALQATAQPLNAAPANSRADAKPNMAVQPLAAEQAAAGVRAEAPCRSPAKRATVEAVSTRQAAADAQPAVPSSSPGLVGGEQPVSADERQTASSEGPKGEQKGEWVKIAADATGENSMEEGFQDHEDSGVASSSRTSNPVAAEPMTPQEPVPEYDDVALAKGKMVALADVDPVQFRSHQQEETAASWPPTDPTEMPGKTAETKQPSRQRNEDLQRAGVIQAFLEGTSSQLTEHGLLSLYQGLRANELAILFRNNHFNTIFSHSNALWLLVTDQGYLFEQKVVWEKLCDVSGNTEFASGNFSCLSGQPAAQDVAAAADLAQAAFAGVVSPQGAPGPVGTADSDADMALAIQLQEEEVERQQRFVAQQQAQQQPHRHPGSSRHEQGKQQTGKGRGGWAAGKSEQQQTKKKDSKCTIM